MKMWREVLNCRPSRFFVVDPGDGPHSPDPATELDLTHGMLEGRERRAWIQS